MLGSRLLPSRLGLTSHPASPANDQQPLPFVPPLLPAPRAAWRTLLADTSYLVLAVTGWVGSTILGVLGAVVACFLVISAGDIDTFFSHLNNLTSRYVTADFGRRAAFEHQIVQVLLVFTIVTVACRLPGFVRRVRRELRAGRQA